MSFLKDTFMNKPNFLKLSLKMTPNNFTRYCKTLLPPSEMPQDYFHKFMSINTLFSLFRIRLIKQFSEKCFWSETCMSRHPQILSAYFVLILLSGYICITKHYSDQIMKLLTPWKPPLWHLLVFISSTTPIKSSHYSDAY